MATNFDPQDFENAYEALRQFGTAVRRTGDTIDDIAESSKGQSKKLDEQNKQSQEKWAQSLKSAGSVALSFSSQLQAGAGSLSSLNTVIGLTAKSIGGLLSIVPFFGNALKTIAETGGDVAQEIVKNFDRAYGYFEQLSDVGVLQTFEDLEQSVRYTGMNFADTNKVLGKFSKELGSLGGSVIAGRGEFEKISSDKATVTMRQNFQKLGISVSEFNEMQLTYISRQQKWGLMQGKNTKDLVAGTEVYIKELDVLSKLTGLSKKDIQAQRDAAMSETRFASALADLPEEVQKAANDLNIMISKTAPAGLAQGMRDLMSGSVSTDAAKQLVIQSGGAATEIMDKLRSGTIGQFEAFRQLQGAVKEVWPQMRQLAKHTGDNNLYTKEAAQIRDFANQKMLTPEEIEKARVAQDKTLKATEGQNAELANAKQKLYNAGKELDSLMVSSDKATWAVDKMADAVNLLSEKLNELLGKSLPADLKARKDEREAIENVTKTRKNTKKIQADIDAIKSDDKKTSEVATLHYSLFGKKDALKKAEAALKRSQDEEAKAVESQKKATAEVKKHTEAAKPKTSQTDQPVTPTNSAPLTATDKRFEGLKIKSDESVAGGEVDQQIVDKMKEFSKQFPGTTINAFNDKYHWQDEKRFQTSKHRVGKAVDFKMNPPPNVKEAAEIVDILKGLGFKNIIDGYTTKHGTGEHFHAELMAKGGVTRGISIAGEAGPEAVVPLPDGRTIPVEIKNERYSKNVGNLEDGRTIPVEIKNERYSKNVGNLDNFELANIAITFKESINELKKLQEATNNRLSELIEETKVNNDHIRTVNETLTASKGIQRNLLTHSMS